MRQILSDMDVPDKMTGVSGKNGDTAENKVANCNAQVYLEETFFILSKKNTVFRVRLTSSGLSLRKESNGSTKEQTILLRDIIGSRCMRSKRRGPGAGSCVCSSLPGPQPLKVVDESSGELDENDISAYLYIYAYILKQTRRSAKRERTTITLRFRSFDKYEDNNKEAQKWRAAIKCLINDVPVSSGLPTPNERKLLVLLNPKSGPGKARELFQDRVAPILAEAEIPYDLHVTKYSQFAREFVRTRNVYSWRGILAVGGDGILFEVLNGFFERLDWQQALNEVPLGISPCGSGNGLSRTICHLYNEPYIPGQLIGPTLSVIRGKRAPMDIVRVETKSQIMFSFLSVGWGLLSDIDIESERLRAFGGQRFTVWTVARLIGLRTYKGVLTYAPITNIEDVTQSDGKQPLVISHSVSQDGALDSPDSEMFADCDENSDAVLTSAPNDIQKRNRLDSWYSVTSRRSAYYSMRGSEYHSVLGSDNNVHSPTQARMYGPAPHLPALTAPLPSHWKREEGEFVLVHGAYQTHLGEEFMFAPRSKLSDGVIWLLIIKAGISRTQLLSFFLGLNNGAHASSNNEFVQMVPVSAFRIVPEGSSGYLTVDGEQVEYGPIQGEIFPNLVNIMVPNL